MVGLSMATPITDEHKLILDMKGLCQIDPNNFEFFASLRAVLVPRGKVMHTGLVGRRLVLAPALSILVSGMIVFLKNSGEGVLILFKFMHEREFVGYISMADLKEMYADNQTKTWLLRGMIYTGVFFVGLLGIASQGRNFIDDSSRLDL